MEKQAEIAKSPFGEKKLGGQNFTAGIVLHTQSGELGPAPFQPIVRAAAQLHQLAEARRAHPTLAMSGRTALSGEAQTVLEQQSAQRFATERNALALHQLLAEMVIVEAGVGATRQLHDLFATLRPTADDG